MKLCSFPGCDNEQIAKDLCSGHYQQRYRSKTGQLKPLHARRGRSAKELYRHILANKNVVEGALDTPCWETTLTKNNEGYGQVSYRGRKWLAPRFIICCKIKRKLKKDEITRHKCDNPACIRPSHLTYGSYSDNMWDMVNRGRHKRVAPRKGEGCHKAKLTERKVKRIRKMYSHGDWTYKDLAAEFGVTFGTIGHIIQGRSWKHVT